MKHRPFVGTRVEDLLTRAIGRALRRRGWHEELVPYTGYGTEEHVRVLGRLVLNPPRAGHPLPGYAVGWLNRRGWRNFIGLPVPHGRAVLRLAGETLHLRTDRQGYIDVTVKAHRLSPGWHKVRLEAPGAEPVDAPVQVIASDEHFGIISDIDDTIISTSLPRIALAIWNSFVRVEGNRQAVPGMARMYQHLLAEHPGAPVIYVSTGAWSALPFLRRFMARHGYPRGAMLLTDLGPTNTGWFRSGPDHKRYSMGELARDFPNISWVLVGDNGQHDPVLYREFADLHPGRVRAIAIRTLTPAEQILAHGTVTVLLDSAHLEWTPTQAPAVSGADGDELWPALHAVLAEPSNEGHSHRATL